METMKKRTLKEGQEVFVINQVTAGANYFGKVRMLQGEQTFDDKTKEKMVHVIITKFIDDDARNLSGLKVGDIITTPVHAVYSVVPNKFCQGFNGERIPICEEHFTDIDAPYYAPDRDENMYECEVMTIDPNTQVPRKVQEKKAYALKLGFVGESGTSTGEYVLAVSEDESLVRERMNNCLSENYDAGWQLIEQAENAVRISKDDGETSKVYEIEDTIILI